MKRFVFSDVGMGAMAGVFAAVVVMLTDAGAGATYLISIAFLTMVVAWQCFDETQ